MTQLASHSIALGIGLLALAFSSTAIAEELITSNPALSMTLVTRTNNPTIVWLRPTLHCAVFRTSPRGLIPIYANLAFQRRAPFNREQNNALAEDAKGNNTNRVCYSQKLNTTSYEKN